MSELMKFDPATGIARPYPSEAGQYREYHGKVAWLFNPFTGQRRDARDVGSDCYGHAIAPCSPQPHRRQAMTDMTAEQALAWLRTIAAISGAVVSDRPLSFSYQEAVKFQAAVKALTAPRVPEGCREALRAAASALYFDDGSDFEPALWEVVDHLSPKIGNMLRSKPSAGWQVIDEMLSAAPAPADPFTHSAELHASRRNGLPTPVHDDDDGRVLQVNSAMPLFTTMEGAELATLRERYDALLAKHQEVLDTVQQCACAYDKPSDVCVGHAKELARLRERVDSAATDLDILAAQIAAAGIAGFGNVCRDIAARLREGETK